MLPKVASVDRLSHRTSSGDLEDWLPCTTPTTQTVAEAYDEKYGAHTVQRERTTLGDVNVMEGYAWPINPTPSASGLKQDGVTYLIPYDELRLTP